MGHGRILQHSCLELSTLGSFPSPPNTLHQTTQLLPASSPRPQCSSSEGDSLLASLFPSFVSLVDAHRPLTSVLRPLYLRRNSDWSERFDAEAVVTMKQMRWVRGCISEYQTSIFWALQLQVCLPQSLAQAPHDENHSTNFRCRRTSGCKSPQKPHADNEQISDSATLLHRAQTWLGSRANFTNISDTRLRPSWLPAGMKICHRSSYRETLTRTPTQMSLSSYMHLRCTPRPPLLSRFMLHTIRERFLPFVLPCASCLYRRTPHTLDSFRNDIMLAIAQLVGQVSLQAMKTRTFAIWRCFVVATPERE